MSNCVGAPVRENIYHRQCHNHKICIPWDTESNITWFCKPKYLMIYKSQILCFSIVWLLSGIKARNPGLWSRTVISHRPPQVLQGFQYCVIWGQLCKWAMVIPLPKYGVLLLSLPNTSVVNKGWSQPISIWCCSTIAFVYMYNPSFRFLL